MGKAQKGVPFSCSVTAGSYCCKRKPNQCDQCVSPGQPGAGSSGGGTCSGLTGLFTDHCPPKPAGKFHPLTPLQKVCCQVCIHA
eukprot:COSAG06_NODE_5871_length_3234_cov_1.776467_7_plen_84_part_00